MLFLMLVKSSEAAMATNPPPPAFMAKMGQYAAEMTKKGILVTSSGLMPSLHSSKVRASKGKLTITDGPFPESKEVLGGFIVIDVGTRAEALEWAARVAVACRCKQEVREIMDDPEVDRWMGRGTGRP